MIRGVIFHSNDVSEMPIYYRNEKYYHGGCDEYNPKMDVIKWSNFMLTNLELLVGRIYTYTRMHTKLGTEKAVNAAKIAVFRFQCGGMEATWTS